MKASGTRLAVGTGRAARGRRLAPLGLLVVLFAGCVPDSPLWSLVIQEQRHIETRDLANLPRVPLPAKPPPATRSPPPPDVAPREQSLDEAIRIALANSAVVRVLAGVTAVASGQTIYDPAISNTTIDEARAVFDPTLGFNNAWNRTETPQAVLSPLDPTGVQLIGPRLDTYNLDLGMAKKTVLGGTARLDFADAATRSAPNFSALNPQDRSAVTMSYTQPLLKGAGVAPNVAPIVIARLNTERSYFQLKDAVQELVRGVIEAYWAVVFARTDVWARKQQVEQGQVAFDLAEARLKAGFGSVAQVAQTRSALANFRANLVSSQANLLQREGALRNILGLPPTVPERLTLTSPPTPVRVEPRWDELIKLAEARRPDLIELKLIIEADEQSLIIANNQAQPQLDTTMLYRWNGLEGETPSGARIGSTPGQFTDWTLGVNFSVPLGLRQSRAQLRRAELILLRDKANLQQGLHAAVHLLAQNYRNLSQFYEQYLAFKEVRAAARTNLEYQLAEVRAGRGIYLNVLQAISDWGNAISFEAQALAQYNTELASLERQTGTILETHGVRFMEERYGSIGPLGRLASPRPYPKSLVPGPNAPRYPTSAEPAERALERESPVNPNPLPPPPEQQLPPPRPVLRPPENPAR
jgi:outer membrane protein TolC